MRAAVVAIATLVAVPVWGCRTPPAALDGDAGDAAHAGAASPDVVVRAEDSRHAKDISAEIRTSHEVSTRRRSARALARIADAASVEGLAFHLADADPETIAWAAYGLGYACKGREDAHVRMLSARAASLPASTERHAGRGVAELDPRTAIARAIGRCGSPLSEQVLVGLLVTGRTTQGPWVDPALVGLGDLATRKKQLGAEATTALLDAAGDTSQPRDLAFYALARAEPSEAFSKRIADVARVALGRPGEARILAIRALGRAGKDDAKQTATDLGRVVADGKTFVPGERAEAARALGGLAEAGQAAIAEAISTLTPDAKDPIAIADLSGAPFHALYSLLSVLGPEPPRRAEAALAVLSGLTPPTQPKPGLARRLSEIRCAAALALARGAWDAEVIRKCDAETAEPSERARLASILRGRLQRDRLAAFRVLAKSEHLKVREAAVEALGSHAEAGEAGAQILADALSSKHAGLVATAAQTLNAHPERGFVLAESEKRAALDPKAPPPTANPTREVAPAIAKALAAAVAEPWPEDRFETRIALVEAVATMHLEKAKDIAGAACNDANPVVRERALKALRTLGAAVTACDAPDREPKPAAEIGKTLVKPARIVLTTDSMSELAITLEPELSPITTTRIASLVRSGFYKGIVVHRVVPGFVAQLGDPDGDGYGGSGTSLRCETSPVAFGPLDVGMALAGRDTGSSQFFVTLSRTPHLDGEYTRIGHAEGDWASVAQGDVIVDARLLE